MQPQVYERFAEFMLSDLAERRTLDGARLPRGKRRRERIAGEQRAVRLWGDHIWYSENVRFRDSDGSFRLAMAVRAYEVAYQLRGITRVHSRACRKVAEMILSSACERIRHRFLKGRRGRRGRVVQTSRVTQRVAQVKRSILWDEDHDPRLDELDGLIANESRRERNRAKTSAEVMTLARTVRGQVSEFRRKWLDYDQLFEMWLGIFRHGHGRDREWYAEAEQEYACRMRRCTRKLGAYHHVTAAHTMTLARLLHEQGKLKNAAQMYKLAIRRWMNAPGSDKYRGEVVASLRFGLQLCVNCQAPSNHLVVQLNHS